MVGDGALEQALQTLQLFIPATGIGTPVVLLMVGWYYSFLDKGGQAPKGVFRQLAWRGFWMLVIGVVVPIALSSAEFWLVGPASRYSGAVLAVAGNVVVVVMLVGILGLVWSAVRLFGASPPGTSALREEQPLVVTDPLAASRGDTPGTQPTPVDIHQASGGGAPVKIDTVVSAHILPDTYSVDEESDNKDGESPD